MEVRLATTADQIAAREIGKDTQVPSLELNLDNPTQGACDSGDCFYVNTVSWRNETTPNLAETHPRVVFERLFGDGGSAAQRLRAGEEHRQHSRFGDAGSESPGGYAGRRATAPSSANIWIRFAKSSSASRTPRRAARSRSSCRTGPSIFPETFEEHTKLMFDLQVLAFRADVTRVFSMIMARELSSRTYPIIGVPEQHHAVSHHRNDPELIAKKAKIDTYHVQLFGYFLEKLQATPDGDGSLLDHSLIMYGGGMGNGNLHRHTDLPCCLAGKLGGQFKTGRHLSVSREHAHGEPAGDDPG